MATTLNGEEAPSQPAGGSQESTINISSNASVQDEGNSSSNEVDLDSLNNDQSRIDSVLNFLLNYDYRKKNVGRPKKAVGRTRKQPGRGSKSSDSRRQSSVLPDEVEESLINIDDLHPGLLVDYLTKLNDFNKKLLHGINVLSNKYDMLVAKSSINQAEASGPSVSPPAPVSQQTNVTEEVKEKDLEVRVDAIEQKSVSHVLLCSGNMITEAIENHPESLRDTVVSSVCQALPEVANESDIVRVAVFGKKKKMVKIECSSERSKKKLISSARLVKPANIYFSEFLTPFRSKMFFSLRSLKKKYPSKISAVYTRDGTVFYKIPGTDGFKTIRHPNDVTNLENRLLNTEHPLDITDLENH